MTEFSSLFISSSSLRCRADFFAKDRSFRIRGTKTCVYGGAHEFGGNIVSLFDITLINFSSILSSLPPSLPPFSLPS